MSGKMSITDSIVYKVLKKERPIYGDSIQFAVIWDKCCNLTGHDFHKDTITNSLRKLTQKGKVIHCERGWYKVAKE